MENIESLKSSSELVGEINQYRDKMYQSVKDFLTTEISKSADSAGIVFDQARDMDSCIRDGMPSIDYLTAQEVNEEEYDELIERLQKKLDSLVGVYHLDPENFSLVKVRDLAKQARSVY